LEDSAYVRIMSADQRSWMGERRPALVHLDIELTERCNNDCIHCCINRPAADATAKKNEMSAEMIKGILRQASDLGCLTVRLTGGEPLLRPDFEEIYLCARRLGFQVVLFTNACLLTPQLADLFVEIPPLAPIEISVYGMQPESYDVVTRRPGSFVKFRKGVNLLLERHVPFIVKSVLLPHLKLERQKFESWAATIPAMRRLPDYTMFLDLRSRRDDDAKNRLIESLRPSSKDIMDVLVRDPAVYRRGMAQFASWFIASPDNRIFRCGATHGMCIDAYGRAQPCIGIRAPELTVAVAAIPMPGKLDIGPVAGPADDPSAPVSLAGAMKQFRKLTELRSANHEYLSRCARCFIKNLCEQCPARSWAEYGSLDTPVACLCEAAHAQARYMGWMGGNEMGWEVTDWQNRVDRERSALIGAGVGAGSITEYQQSFPSRC